MVVLGISAYTHDVAVALVTDHEPIFLIEEERLSRQKHHDGFIFGGGSPNRAILEALTLKLPDNFSHSHLHDFSAADHNLSQRRHDSFATSLDPDLSHSSFYDHHLCHAASTYFTSSFSKAYICTLDSRGDGLSGTVYLGDGGKLEQVTEFPAINSICAFYAYATELLGLGRRNEGSLMALAGMGNPDLGPPDLLLWTGRRFHAGGAERLAAAVSKTDTLSHKADVAAAVQLQFEIAVESMLDDVCKDRDVRMLALAGGGFLNCVLNGRLAVSDRWDSVYVVPAPGDSGLGLGAAILATPDPAEFHLNHAYWGAGFCSDEVQNLLIKFKLPAKTADPMEVARLVANGLVGGFFVGRMEFGPRALGHRSIVADPRRKESKHRVNEIKRRQSWRPVSPAVLHADGAGYFEQYFFSPFMAHAFRATERCACQAPAAVHVDGTSRV